MQEFPSGGDRVKWPEASYRENSAEVKKVYERMRCGTLGSPRGPSDRLVLPPLSVFCTFPSVRALKGSPDPNRLLPDSTSVASDINSSLAISLITSDLHGWQSASARTLPPLKRVTARFFCLECGKGEVGKRYERERCMDFKGVCSHVCVGARGKNIEGRESEIGNGQEKGGKKGGVKTLDWNVDRFEKDEKVSRFLRPRPVRDAHARRPFLWLKPYSIF
ncbi:hypothetical protein HD554DRAFT_2088791 [Boletus coccyginus]|nr:hypothetical protein HD554DRAFT_2088791 [Boletus coccyginus]